MKKGIIKWGLFLLLGMGFLVTSGFGLLYYQVQGRFEVDEEKYPYHVGYLSPENADFSKDFERCSDELPIGFYHSTAPHIYNNGKPAFQAYILANFENEPYSDNGYLNLRFLIDCEGDLGDLEVNELNTDLELTDLSDELVNDLVALAMRPENWASLKKKEPRDMYMYLLFKLENGKVVEIIP